MPDVTTDPSNPPVVPGYINPMQLIFECMEIEQQTRGNQQMVDSETTQMMSEDVEQQIIDAQDPSNANSKIAQDLTNLNNAMKNPSADDFSALVAQAQSQLQADSASLSNQQNQASSLEQQSSNRAGQDSSDMSQATQLCASIIAILSANASMLANHY